MLKQYRKIYFSKRKSLIDLIDLILPAANIMKTNIWRARRSMLHRCWDNGQNVIGFR